MSPLLLLTLLAASPPEEPMPASLNDLAPLGPVTLTLTGEAHPAPLSGTPCVFFDLTVGDHDPETGWTSHRSPFHTQTDLVARVVTADGRSLAVPLPWRKLRPHLDPTTARHLDPATGPLDDRDRALAEDWGGPVTLHEYCLVAGRTYHAVVDGETYHLPPDGSGEPVQRTNLVLVLSEHPLVEGRPVNRLIPTFAGWSY